MRAATPEPRGGVAALLWSDQGGHLDLGFERDAQTPLRWVSFNVITGLEVAINHAPSWNRQPVYWGMDFRSDFRGLVSQSGRYRLEMHEPPGGTEGNTLWLVDQRAPFPATPLITGGSQYTVKDAQWVANETMFAFTWGPMEYGADLYVHRVGTGQSVQSVAETVSYAYAGVAEWRLSPDGSRIAVIDGRALWIVSLAGDEAIRVPGFFEVPVWSHDGMILFSYYRANAATFERSLVAVYVLQRAQCTVLSSSDLEQVQEAGVDPIYAYDVSPDAGMIAFVDYFGHLAIARVSSPSAQACGSLN